MNTYNTYCQKLENDPLDEEDTENKFYSQKTFLGKEFIFNFFMEGGEPPIICYDNCQTCNETSKDENNQKCIDCKDNYYKIFDTNNCFKSDKEGYYLDNNTKFLMPCYENCLTCNNNGISTQMNCLSCKNNFKFYEKSKNCLNCEKYVNYLQTECINEIPEGYYIDDEYLGTLGKCYELCKTCEKGPNKTEDEIHMNCKECKFTNIDYKTEIEGNCPDSQKDDDKDNKENKGGTNILIWILVPSIIVIILIILVFFIIRRRKKEGAPNDYSKLDQKGQNISMEATSGLGFE